MCPFSGFVQSLLLLLSLVLICHAVVARALLRVSFSPPNVTVHMYDTVTVEYEVTEAPDNNTECMLVSGDAHIASIPDNIMLRAVNQSGAFNITGNFLGQTAIACRLNSSVASESRLAVKCLRKQRLIDRIFTASTATLVAIIYINFGCVVQWVELRHLLRKPVGPLIGLCGHFFVMPLVSYGLGLLLFPDNPAMRLGLFFTGVSPAGGASNIWTAILDGNIELSILMTTVSTVAAFGMMPLWFFTLGKTIFKDARLEVPYFHISSYVFALVFPLALGYLINRFFPRAGAFLGRILKRLSTLLIAFIIVFAIVTNLYLFQLFSWRIVVAGMGLPWLGYLLGYALALLSKQPAPDALAIAIETGIENTGIAIFLLRFALEPLHADLTTVAPVAVALMTPFPLTALYLYKRLKRRLCSPYNKSETTELCPEQAQCAYRDTHGKQDSAVACLS